MPSIWTAYCIFREEEEKPMQALIGIAFVILQFLGSAFSRNVHHYA